jgi:hypothetical protein
MSSRSSKEGPFATAKAKQNVPAERCLTDIGGPMIDGSRNMVRGALRLIMSAHNRGGQGAPNARLVAEFLAGFSRCKEEP